MDMGDWLDQACRLLLAEPCFIQVIPSVLFKPLQPWCSSFSVCHLSRFYSICSVVKTPHSTKFLNLWNQQPGGDANVCHIVKGKKKKGKGLESEGGREGGTLKR